MSTPPNPAMGGNPMAGGMARALIDKLAGQGASPMQSGGITGGEAQSPEAISQLMSSRMAELGGADPKAVKRVMMQMKQQVATLIPQLAFRIPSVTKHLSTLFSTIDKVLEEIEKASATQDAVKATPLGGGIASMNPPTGGNIGDTGGVPSMGAK